MEKVRHTTVHHLIRTLILLLLVTTLAAPAGAVTPSAQGTVWQYDALVVGVPFEDVGSTRDAGIVQVIHGAASGLTAAHHEVKYQNLTGVEDKSEIEDYFGYTVAGGDFNGDGYPDLAVGVPREDVQVRIGFVDQTIQDAGAVHVFYGTASGLDGPNKLWTRADFVSPLFMRADERFGHALAVGDFNGDGYDDLAVGIPFGDVNLLTDAGAVRVIYGSANGLRAQGSQFLNQADYFPDTVAEAEDRFGWSVTAGDFDGDGYDDLAIGVPLEDTGDGADVGIVNVIYGSRTGLAAGRTGTWSQARLPVVRPQPGDQFGLTLTSGDYNGDGYDDLVVGVPLEDIGTTTDAGVINLIFGSNRGLQATAAQTWYQGFSSVPGMYEQDDLFGLALASGDFNGDGYEDLAVGAPYEDLGSATDAGAVIVFYGSATGPRAAGSQLWHQNISDIIGVAENTDFFGASLAGGDFNGDGYDDLAIGAPGESIYNTGVAGVVHVLYGGSAGLRAAGNQLWDQKGLPGVGPEYYDQFGKTLAVLKAPSAVHSIYLPAAWKAWR